MVSSAFCVGKTEWCCWVWAIAVLRDVLVLGLVPGEYRYGVSLYQIPHVVSVSAEAFEYWYIVRQ